MNHPATHEQLQKEFKDLLTPFNAEKLSGQCADIVVRERIKMLTNTVSQVERMVDRVVGHSDKSTGEWVNPNPHDPAQRSVE